MGEIRARPRQSKLVCARGLLKASARMKRADKMSKIYQRTSSATSELSALRGSCDNDGGGQRSNSSVEVGVKATPRTSALLASMSVTLAEIPRRSSSSLRRYGMFVDCLTHAAERACGGELLRC